MKGDFEGPEPFPAEEMLEGNPHLAPNESFPRHTVAGVVIIIMESTRADMLHDLHSNAADAHPFSVPSRSLFVSNLATKPGTTVARYAFPSMPNTNKSLLQILCGLTPMLETSWDEFGHRFKRNVREECLPRRLSKDMGWASLFASSSHIDPENTKSTIQASVGFDTVLGGVDLWPRCRAHLLAKEPVCDRLHFSPVLTLLTSGNQDGGLHHRNGNDLCLKSLRSIFMQDRNDSLHLRDALIKDFASMQACSHIDDDGPSLSGQQLLACFSSACILPENGAPRTQSDAADDELLVEPILAFAESSIAKGRPFISSLLTTGTHYPYQQSRGLSSALSDFFRYSNNTFATSADPPAGSSRAFLARRLIRRQISAALSASAVVRSTFGSEDRMEALGTTIGPPASYLAATRRADDLTRRIFKGLASHFPSESKEGLGSSNPLLFANGESLADRTLFVVVGDHGEAFGEGGGVHWQHGTCVYASCLQVPFLVHDPFSRQNLKTQWREGLSSLSDVAPTVLAWCGLRLVNSSTSGTLLRQGVSILPNNRNPVRRVLRVFSFFDPKIATVLLLGRKYVNISDEIVNNSNIGQSQRKVLQIIIDKGKSLQAIRLPVNPGNRFLSEDSTEVNLDELLTGNVDALSQHLLQYRTKIMSYY
eukprot:CAMPEP_0171698628 /NCGR_PEP_ID=MMETSP0991-20121206/9465_1 /TAXON_ID=483369 /ORGANISM="non described non described, Strain CCMP2098" /LENGTH=650 /DNA_ID=CAMNT_0012287519 /DNA_START=181 /DNA_END=2130 /DNA_ORIENTATION=-